MLTIRLGVAALGAAVLSGITLFGASAQICDDRYPKTCQVAPNYATATQSSEAIAMRQKPKTAKHKKKQVTKQRREEPQDEAILTGYDTVGLVARLPWWRVDEAQFVQAELEQVASPVLTVAEDVVPAPSDLVHDELVDGVRIASSHDLNEIDLAGSAIRIASAHEINELDLTAPPAKGPANQSWLHYILATLGGALAAASTARFLFA
jgi:hypothetical protein